MFRDAELQPQSSMGAGRRSRSYRAAWQGVITTFKRVCGMPDYDAYVRHITERHPGCAVPSEREFFEQYLRGRYEGGPTRCC